MLKLRHWDCLSRFLNKALAEPVAHINVPWKVRLAPTEILATFHFFWDFALTTPGVYNS